MKTARHPDVNEAGRGCVICCHVAVTPTVRRDSRKAEEETGL